MDTIDIVPQEIEIFNNFLISRNKADEKLFTVIDLDKKEIIANFINIGQGPEDMLYPSFAGYDKDYIYISDNMSSRVNVYRLTNILHNKDFHSIKQINFQRKINGGGGAKLIKDGFIGAVWDANNMKIIYNKEGEVKDSIPYPTIDKELSIVEKLQTFQNNTCSNIKDRIAMCYMVTDLIDFYDNNGKLLKRMHGPRQFLTNIEEVTYKNGATSARIRGISYDAYMCPKNINNELWVLYSGKDDNNPNYEYSYNYILTFSWDGKPLKAYHFDHGILDFSVDTKNHIIYGVTHQPDTHIITFAY